MRVTIQTIQPQAGGSISLNMTYGNAHLNKSIQYNLKGIIFFIENSIKIKMSVMVERYEYVCIYP